MEIAVTPLVTPHPDRLPVEVVERKGRGHPDVTDQALAVALAVEVNAADDPAAGSFYLTVTGTSAEAGDDGQAGRGNRVGGLITPYRPMVMESAAGKNPVTHVGKLYNVLARRLAAALVDELPEVAAAECFLVSRIGEPVARPGLVHVAVGGRDGGPATEALRPRIEEVARPSWSAPASSPGSCWKEP